MPRPIRYRMNYEKAIEAIVWLADQKSGIDIYHIVKVLFYADKKHINQYARPILGDTYICADYGPMPSGIRDLLTENSWLDPSYIQLVAASIKIIQTSPYMKVAALRKANLDYFSGTEIECLHKALKEYGDKSFSELKELSHDEKCYQETEFREPIDYSLMVDDDNPNREQLIKELADTAPYIQL